MSSIAKRHVHWVFLFLFAICFLLPNQAWSGDVELFLMWDNDEEVPWGTWTRVWNQQTPVRVKVVLSDFNAGEVIPFSWNREITSDPALSDKIASGNGTYTYTDQGEEEFFYIELLLPVADPIGWGVPNSYGTYTVTMQIEIPGFVSQKQWYHWWEYVPVPQTGTCVSLVKNGVDSSGTWSLAWNEAGAPQYSEELGWYDTVVVTLEDLSAPVAWRWRVESVNDTVLPPIEQSGYVNPQVGEQEFTIIIPYPDPGCSWGAPNSEGLCVSKTTLWISTCTTQTWNYTWEPECAPCPGDLNISPDTIAYKSTSDYPPLDFPGYEWPEEGFAYMPEYMTPFASYFKSVLITSGVERAFPGWCVDLYTLLEFDELYTNGEITIHRTLNPDNDGDGFADQDNVIGTTSNLLINVNGNIVGAPENLARVNYLINQYYRGVYAEYGVTYAEIQAAIWELLSIGQSQDNGYSNIVIDPVTGIGSGGLISWDESLKDLIIQDALQVGVEKYSPTQCELMGVIVQTGEGRQTVLMMVPYCFYKCLEFYAHISGGLSNYEDGLASSNEGLTFPCVTGVVSAGTGLSTQPGVINIDVPGTVRRALIYWEGETALGTPHGSIDGITINGETRYGILIGGPTKFFTDGGNGDVLFQTYRGDITDMIIPGSNTLTIEGLDFDYPAYPSASGAGVVVIYEEQNTSSEVHVRDGQDLAYENYVDELQTTVPQVFSFDPTIYDRVAKLVLLVGNVNCSSLRPNNIIIDVGGNQTVYSNLLGGRDGCEWDTVSLDVTLPAGSTSLTVEVVSIKTPEQHGARLAWVCAALSVPDVCYFGNEISETVAPLVVVDGKIDDWNLQEDFFDNMYRAANPDKKIESFVYLQYDEFNDVLYTLVLANEGVTVLNQPDDAYVKIDSIKQVDGTFGNDGYSPDFEWVYAEDGTLIGWEASTPLGDGDYDFNVHTQVYDDSEEQTSAVAFRNILLRIKSSIVKPVFLVIDEDGIDNGTAPNNFKAADVNDGNASIGYRNQLNYFANNIGQTITLYSGQVGDEGWFAPKFIPTSWIYAGPSNDGVVNFISAGPGLGSIDGTGNKETLLDGVPNVSPLRAEGLNMLEDRIVFAIVYDGDVGVNYGPLTGNLKGANLGIVAFKVLSVESNTDISPSMLPKVKVEILDASSIKRRPMELMLNAPEPISSSEPHDVDPPSPFSTDLQAFWNFDEENNSNIIAYDRTNNNHDGVLINSPSRTTGKIEKGISLDGSNDYVDAGSFNITGSEMTVCAWIRADKFNHLTGKDPSIVSKAVGTTEADHYWMLSTADVSGNVRLRFRLKTTNSTTSTLVAESGNLSTGTWIHVAAVYNGNYMILYKDGVEVGRMAKTGTVAENNLVPIWIGSNPPVANSKPFDGIIDEVRLYSKALSQADIQAVMTGIEILPTPTPTNTPTSTPTPTLTPTMTPTPTMVTAPNLLAYWSFDEGSGSTTEDRSGNGNTGTLLSGAYWRLGKYDWGGGFDGYNDYVDVGTMDVSGNQLTISAWIKADRFDNTGGMYARIIGKAVGVAEQDTYWMLSTIYDGSTAKLRFRLKTEGNTSTLIASSGNLSVNVWTHAAVVYDGNNMIIYKDGVEVGRTYKAGPIDTNSSVPVWIGNCPYSSSSRPFDGTIDDVRVYNMALSPSEIQSVMNSSGVLPGKRFGPRNPEIIIQSDEVLFTSPTPTVTPTPTFTPTPPPYKEEDDK